MTWTTYHTRGETLRTVMAVADERRDGLLPMDADGVLEHFDDELDLLAALQLRWHTRLSGQIEHQLMDQPMDLESAVVGAWHLSAAEMPGVLAILDHYRAEPADEAMAAALAKAITKEHVLLAVMAGKAGYADELARRAGAAIEERARTTCPPLPGPPTTGPRRSLLDRLRAVIAA